MVEEAESVSKDQVVGIGFDATCSLVLVGQVGSLKSLMIVKMKKLLTMEGVVDDCEHGICLKKINCVRHHVSPHFDRTSE